jgi:hypothetical protein
MKRFVEGVDRGQSTLFPECLDDWGKEDPEVGGGSPVVRSARGFRELLAPPLNCERRLPNAATVNSPQWHRADTVLLLPPATGVRGQGRTSACGI